MKIKQITNPDNNMWRSADPPQRAERVAARIGGGGLYAIDQEHGLSDKSGNKTNATPARIGSYNTIYTAAHYNAGKFFPLAETAVCFVSSDVPEHIAYTI